MLVTRVWPPLARGPCFAASRPIAAQLGLHSQRPASWRAKRVFTTTPRHRKDDAGARTIQAELSGKQPLEESVKPETVKKAKPAEPVVAASKGDPLLAEQTLSTKDQRQADWAIIKDMAQYLWPKNDFGTRFRVALSVGLLVGAKVCDLYPCVSGSCRLMLIVSVGPQCTSTVLLQKYSRLDEHRFCGYWWHSDDCCGRLHLCM